MIETDAEKAYVKLQQAQGCYDRSRPQLKLLEHEMGGTYHHENFGLYSTWRFPDDSKLYVRPSRVFVG